MHFWLSSSASANILVFCLIQTVRRPIIFAAHSLGGLVLKSVRLTSCLCIACEGTDGFRLSYMLVLLEKTILNIIRQFLLRPMVLYSLVHHTKEEMELPLDNLSRILYQSLSKQTSRF